MIVRKLVVLALAAALGLATIGCEGNGGSSGTGKKSSAPVPASPTVANKMTAHEKLATAEAAEKSGNYSGAMEGYEQLRSYPEASRPKDLDDRIARLQAKMSKQGAPK